MDSIIIRHNRGANPEKDPRKPDLAKEVAALAEKSMPVLRPPKAEFSRHKPITGAVEGDIVPNPNVDVEAARTNLLRVYGETEALK